MSSLEKRVKTQRALVVRLRQRLAFELLVLDRLEGRAERESTPDEEKSIASILRNARLREQRALP